MYLAILRTISRLDVNPISIDKWERYFWCHVLSLHRNERNLADLTEINLLPL